MKIKFSPRRMDAALALSVDGAVITLNGKAFDLSGLEPGDQLPATALDTEWLAGYIMFDDELTVIVVLPHGPDAPEETAFPQSLSGAEGSIDLPAWTSDPALEVPQPVLDPGAGAIDWAQCERAADIELQRLISARASARLDRTQMAFVFAQGNLITEVEAEAWAVEGKLPPLAVTTLAKITDASAQFEARMTLRGMAGVERNAAVMDLIAKQAKLKAADLDQMFGIV